MEIQYMGANCVEIHSGKNSLFTDANLAAYKVPLSPSKADVILASQKEYQLDNEKLFQISDPGEYEIAGFAIVGVSVRSHTDEKGRKSAVLYRIMSNNVSVCVTGHMHPEISDEDLETIGMVDVLVIPVGGHGFTLDAIGAASLARKISPKIIIPTHYEQKGVSYPVPQDPVELFVKEMGLQHEVMDRLKIKNNLPLPENTQIVELNKLI